MPCYEAYLLIRLIVRRAVVCSKEMLLDKRTLPANGLLGSFQRGKTYRVESAFTRVPSKRTKLTSASRWLTATTWTPAEVSDTALQGRELNLPLGFLNI
jgi:hypothetical protein